jgi:hypothetical protein
MTLVVDPAASDAALAWLADAGTAAWRIGIVEPAGPDGMRYREGALDR